MQARISMERPEGIGRHFYGDDLTGMQKYGT